MKIQDKSRCLLLNADFTPLRTIHWTKAILWSLRYQEDKSFPIQIIKYHSNEFITGTNGKVFPLPSIAKTITYYNIYDRRITFSRKNLFIRDDYTCQYCGNIFNINQLTYDHIVPKSRFKSKDKFKATNWNNIVTACRACNHKKGNKTPVEANMTLIKQPSKPTFSIKYLPLYNDETIITCTNLYNDWKTYLEITK
jgi:5-methylcytosine-specific restriction endonuclease McrA